MPSEIKKFTSKTIYTAIKDNPRESRKEWMIYLFDQAGKRNANNNNFQFWQQDNHYEELFTPQMLKEKLGYLHSNPVKAGIVKEPQHYIYSSAIDYFTGEKGMIDVDHLQVW